jgi:hypothetical protein
VIISNNITEELIKKTTKNNKTKISGLAHLSKQT